MHHTNAEAVFARISNPTFTHLNAEAVFTTKDSPTFIHMNTDRFRKNAEIRFRTVALSSREQSFLP